MSSREESVQHFLDLIKKSRRGKFKVCLLYTSDAADEL